MFLPSRNFRTTLWTACMLHCCLHMPGWPMKLKTLSHLPRRIPISWKRCSQGKTKGQQLKDKIVSELSTLFCTFHTFPDFSPGPSPSKQMVLAQWKQKRRKDNKKNGTNRCCKLVVACLSSSYVRKVSNLSTLWRGQNCNSTKSRKIRVEKTRSHHRVFNSKTLFSQFCGFWRLCDSQRKDHRWPIWRTILE